MYHVIKVKTTETGARESHALAVIYHSVSGKQSEPCQKYVGDKHKSYIKIIAALTCEDRDFLDCSMAPDNGTYL